jgi:hypothetical protein
MEGLTERYATFCGGKGWEILVQEDGNNGYIELRYKHRDRI